MPVYPPTVRTARKAHKCEHGRWRKRTNREAICSGTIEPGEKYAESYEYGEPYHPARYHLKCWETEMGVDVNLLPCLDVARIELQESR